MFRNNYGKILAVFPETSTYAKNYYLFGCIPIDLNQSVTFVKTADESVHSRSISSNIISAAHFQPNCIPFWLTTASLFRIRRFSECNFRVSRDLYAKSHWKHFKRAIKAKFSEKDKTWKLCKCRFKRSAKNADYHAHTNTTTLLHLCPLWNTYGDETLK